MLPLPNLTTKDFQTLFEEAKNRIPALTKEWTDFNYHDTGITLLQLFAWLFEMQHYYADAVGEVHYYKYLKLLGYTPLERSPSKALIALEGINEDIIFPKGTPFRAEDIMFESEEQIEVIPNRIASILRGNQYTDITEILTAYDKSYESIWEAGIGSCFYIGFENALKKEQYLPLYINIYEGNTIRNVFERHSLKMAACSWELFTEQGWREITDVTDETSNFLQEGYIMLKPSQESIQVVLNEEYGALHYVRCTLVENNYDILPRLSYVAMNIFPVQQKHTLAVSFYIDSTGEDRQCYTLPHYLAQEGEIITVVKKGDRWEIWENTLQDPSYQINFKNRFEKEIQFDKMLYGKVPTKGENNIYIIVYDKTFYAKRFLGKIEGYVNQQMTLEEDELYQDDFKLAIYTEQVQESQLMLCEKVNNLSLYRDNNCIYEIKPSNIIAFGEGIYKSSTKGSQGKVMVTDLVLTQGSAGNVKENKINQATHTIDAALPELRIFNIKSAVGGRDTQTIEEAIHTFRKQFAVINRGITCKDYEKIIKQTPGLMIHKVKAISETKLRTDIIHSNKLCIIVKPYGEEKRPDLSPVYKRIIKDYIENYRLLTTQIDIQAPVYLPIDVYGCLYIRKGYDGSGVHAAIKNAVDSVEGYRDFGESIIFGALFGQIETLESIGYIDNLSLEPVGYGGEKNLGGDIIIKPNVLTYLRNYHVELR